MTNATVTAGAATLGPGLAIEAVGLTKTYPGGVRALRGLSLQFPLGSIFALLGPNGAGKSTAVKVLTTLSRPDSGGARVAGYDILSEAEAVRRAIGVVSQKPAGDLDATGWENLMLQGHLYGLAGAELKRRAEQLVEVLSLGEVVNRIVKTYSGGTQRKLDIAIGLVNRPRVLFLDEPTTGLDPDARAEMWETISRLAREGLGVLLTTHYLEEADQLSDRLAIVDHGEIVAEGTADELKHELRGDSVSLQLTDEPPPDSVEAALAAIDGLLNDRSYEAGWLRARVDNGPTALPALLAALDGAGVRVSSASVARPSLDDVYLSHTGHAYNALQEN